MKHKFKFLSLSKSGGMAQFTMMLPLGSVPLESMMAGGVLDQIKQAASTVGTEVESLAVGRVSQWGAQPAPVQFNTVDELLPKESDYFYKDYRAISATLAPCYGLDYSKPGVLEASVEMLKRQTVYKDHYFYSVDNWVGVVSDSVWDAKGADAQGIPGINARLKLDSKKDPMLVRGVAMDPPAVHSASVTVAFEFEFSHPDLVEEGRFWALLMEEVGGELVRLIVTKIHWYAEISLVWQGAQYENKQLPGEAGPAGSTEMGAKSPTETSAGGGTITTEQRSETVKLSAEMRKMLGLPDTVGEDVSDELLLPALTQMGARAQAGDALLDAARAECRRVAKLAVLGGEEGTLPDALESVIGKAEATELTGLTEMYSQQAAARFPQHGRSSVEDSATVHQAGGVQPAVKKPGKQVPVY